MKNKLKFIKILFLVFFWLLNKVPSSANDIIINAETVDITENGNLISGKGLVDISDGNNIKIKGNEANYNRSTQYLEIKGNVIFVDKNSNYKAISDKVIFDRSKNIISSQGNIKIYLLDKNNVENIFKITGQKSIFKKNQNSLEIQENVVIDDIVNNYKIFSNNIIYDRNKEVFKSNDKTKIDYKNDFLIYTKDIVYNKKKQIIFTKNQTEIIDKSNNKFNLSNFELNLNQEIFKAEKIELSDKENNLLNLEQGYVDLKKSELIGSDFIFKFNKNIFGNSENDPRLIGRYIITDLSETNMKKSSYTTCKNIDGKCPAWSISADEVTHEKEKKRLKYKNAWLEMYDIPVAYFPYFHHPDPTVKRQSGFLFPQFNNSSNLGFSTQIPYFKVIDYDKDMTISPRVFSNNNLFLQTEYRQVFKNSDLITDFSFNKKNNSNSHFFSTLNTQLDNSFYEVKLELVSNENYLKKYQIKSPLINNYTVLNSSISYEKITDNFNFSSSFDVFEDLSKKSSDKYEYSIPNYVFTKQSQLSDSFFDELSIKSSGNYRKFNTNVDEADIINELIYSKNTQSGQENLDKEFNLLIRNINTHGNFSKKYKEDQDHKLVTTGLLNFKYPLIKNTKNGTSFLTPIASLRYSPNPGLNQKNEKINISYNDLFLMDRINNKTNEQGFASTLGLEFLNKSKNNKDLAKMGVGINFRDKVDKDIPLSTSLGKKTSDLIGYSGINITENLSLGYDFSVKQNLSDFNYSLLTANYTSDNFKTKFEFLEKSNFIGDESYLSNITELDLNKSNSLIFETNKNIDKDLTNYYNLIYKYKNDCLEASLTYNKQFYDDDSVNSGKNIFLKVSFIPFGAIESANLNE